MNAKILVSSFNRYFFLFFICTAQASSEYIQQFSSDVTVNRDGSLDVQETIVYVNQDRQGLHGIFREIPTRYKDKGGLSYNASFELKRVTRNGLPVPYDLEHEYEGVRIKIGDRYAVAAPGTYTYVLRYHTDYQIGFFKDHDTLYWNVTGNGWPFAMYNVSARVTLPAGIAPELLWHKGYTGRIGSKEQLLTSVVNGDGSVAFAAKGRLSPHEGLTLYLEWPKGFVKEPTAWDRFIKSCVDNSAVILMLMAFLFMVCWYIFWWRFMRRQEDLQGGPIIPLFYAPENMSPGAVRYVLTKRYDPRQFAAEVVDMAVKGLLTIDYKVSTWWGGDYTLSRQEGAQGKESFFVHNSIMESLFAKVPVISLSSKNSEILQRVARIIESSYIVKYSSLLESNSGFILFPLLVFVPALIIAFALDHRFIGDWFIFIIIGVMLLLIMGYYLLKSYTAAGAVLKNKILGFKMFLEATETDRFEVIGTPPTKTPELYEKYLPYAIALGVEQQWSRQFASVFEKLEHEGHSYHPHWHRGDNFRTFDATSFTSQISNSLQSASTSSGRGGRSGGSSGGGRGGGGGGSW